jgi:hypothetical protein
MSEHATEPAVEPEPEPVDDDDDDDAHVDDDDAAGELTNEELDEHENEQQASSNAIVQALQREETRHRKALAKALGVAEAELHECPTCEAMGYTPEAIDAEPELRQDPTTDTCPVCAGEGQTKTGATIRGLYAKPCSGCGGTGYVQHAEQPAAQPWGPNGLPTVIAGGPPLVTNPHDEELARELRSKGYTIVEPVTVPAPSAP